MFLTENHGNSNYSILWDKHDNTLVLMLLMEGLLRLTRMGDKDMMMILYDAVEELYTVKYSSKRLY